MITEFSNDVIKELSSYVYRLIDPRNGNTFYVGKGKGNRVFAHMNAELTYEGDEDAQSEKISTIREIRSSGLEVIHIIHRHGLDDATAFEVEAALIDTYPGLSNYMGGKDSRDRGPMNAEQIQNLYSAETLDAIDDKCLIIKINQNSLDRFDGIDTAYYEATRSAWKLNLAKAEKADYVLSVLNGMIKGVYCEMVWHIHYERNRKYFDAVSAPPEIWQKYVGKLIPEQYRRRGIQSPCLYTF
jgi:hypothetical protein